jgi:hypothetical protein
MSRNQEKRGSTSGSMFGSGWKVFSSNLDKEPDSDEEFDGNNKTLLTDEEINVNQVNESTNRRKFGNKVRKVLRSHKFHFVLIALVIFRSFLK